MTLTHMRCPYCHGKNVEAQRTYTIQCGEPRTLYYCAPCARTFSETRHTPLAHIPPHYVVERVRRSSKATRGEDLQVEHPIWCRYVSAFHFHSTLTGMLGATLIRDQVI
jgi:DNA-directed RNA polymerase subunit RPC12/RpoP